MTVETRVFRRAHEILPLAKRDMLQLPVFIAESTTMPILALLLLPISSCETEVDEITARFAFANAHEEILGFEIAMDVASLVQMPHAIHHLHAECHDRLQTRPGIIRDRRGTSRENRRS